MSVQAVLFDLDGVLVDACDWHYFSLNRALGGIGLNPISREDHINIYNGLPTNVKLQMLGLNETESAIVWQAKQDFTLDTIRNNSKIQEEKIELLRHLREQGIKIACVTNSIEETTNEMLKSTGQFDFFDLIITNEMVSNNKPYPDCYNLAVESLDVNPTQCIIVEDSPKGLESAKASVIPNKNIWTVKNTTDVEIKNYRRFVSENFNSNGG